MKPKIGIIGAGVMGKGVAERFANYGYQVIILDNDDKVASKVISDIFGLLFTILFWKWSLFSAMIVHALVDLIRFVFLRFLGNLNKNINGNSLTI